MTEPWSYYGFESIIIAKKTKQLDYYSFPELNLSDRKGSVRFKPD